MESTRLPRFKRAPKVAPMRLTERDREIVRLICRHRFLRSSHIIALIGDSSQQLLRRLQLLYHHGFLERPRAQIDYYHRGGSRQIVYGLGKKGASLLQHETGSTFQKQDWGERNRAIGRMFLEHALLVSDVMVSIEMACRQTGQVRLLTDAQLPIPNGLKRQREPFSWNVSVSSRLKLGLAPDRVFALEFANQPPDRN